MSLSPTIRKRIFGPGACYESDGSPVPIRLLLLKSVARRLEYLALELRIRSNPFGSRRGHRSISSVLRKVVIGR